MRNSQKRRILKEARAEVRTATMEDAQRAQLKKHERDRKVEPRPKSLSGCQKRRRRKHHTNGFSGRRPMQSKKGYLRPYYPWEYEAIARGER